EEIGLGSGLDDAGVGHTAGAIGAEDEGAYGDGGDDSGGEPEVLPERAGNEGDAVFVGELVVLLDVGVAAHSPAGHGPLADAKLEDHPHMDEGEQEQCAGDDEYVEREEAGERGSSDYGAA